MIHILGTDIPKELYNVPVFLYGGGSTGKVLGRILRNKGIVIRGYIDDDPAKWGGVLMVCRYCHLLLLSIVGGIVT